METDESWKTRRAAEQAREEKVRNSVREALEKKGVKIRTHACGCCDGVSFSLEIDGETIVKQETGFNFSNFGDAADNIFWGDDFEGDE